MAKWQKSSARQPHKTKAELREMLTEAVRNTVRADGSAASVQVGTLVDGKGKARP